MLHSVRSRLVLVVLMYFYSHVRSEANEVTSPHLTALINPRNVSDIPPTAFENHLEGSSILYGLSKVANENLITQVCLNELKHIRRSVLLKKPWAMKVLDASASKTAGFMYQHNFWLGSRETCATAKDPLGLTLYKIIKRNMKPGLVEEVAPFDVEFRVVYLKLNSPWQLPLVFSTKSILHVGLCLPASCSSSEVKQLTQELIQRKSFVPADLYEFNADVLYVKDLKLKAQFFERRSFIILVVLVIFTCSMMLGAHYINKSNAIAESSKLSAVEGKEVLAKKYGNDLTEKNSRSDGSMSGLKNFVKCFDVRENYQQMFSTTKSTSNEIPAINGLRAVAAFAILNVHIMFYMVHTVNNLPVVLGYLERKTFQVHNIPFYLVDAFLTISGFLQTFQFFQDTKGIEDIRGNSFIQNVRRFFLHLFHRYLRNMTETNDTSFRLAPLYFVTMGVVDLVTAFVNDVSLFHIYDRNDQNCGQFWWRNILFIQNYFSMDELCLNWTWTLSCEMQYFILGSVLLHTYVKHPKLVKYIVVGLLPLKVVWILFKGTTERFQFAFEATYLTAGELYINPFLRGVPYILGSMAAWHFMEQKRHLNISPALEKCLWHLAALFIFGCVYSMYWRDLDYIASISLYLLGRSAMSLTVCWIILASATGRGSCWSRILEAQIFQPVSRLTYAIYLVNPLIIILSSSLSESSIRMDLVVFILYVCGFSVIVYLVSIGFSLAFEVPYCNWSKKMLRRSKRKDE